MEHHKVFAGFQPLKGKLTFLRCPNQFLDTCIRFSTRGEIRLVSHYVHEAYRVVDEEDGSPTLELNSVSHAALHTKLGISNGAFSKTLESCFQKRFIDGVRRRGEGEYCIRCSNNPTIDPDRFSGFYDGRGYWTPIPLEFFTYVIPTYTLAEIRVAAAILRHTLGYEEKLGHRRKKCVLTVDLIQEYTRIRDRKTVTDAIATLEEDNIIECVQRGVFHPNPRLRQPSVYAPKWNASNDELEHEFNNLPKTQPAANFQKPNQETFPQTQLELPKTQPGHISKNPTNRKTLPCEKQQQRTKEQVVVVNQEGFGLLRRWGVGKSTATMLSEDHTAKHIKQTIHMLPLDNATNPAGMIINALKDDCSLPKGAAVGDSQQDDSQQHEQLEKAQQAAHEAAVLTQQQQRNQRRTQLLSHWEQQPPEDRERYQRTTAEQAPDSLTKKRLINCDLDNPSLEILEVMNQAIGAIA